MLADASHRCSPKKFTQPKLFAGLVLKSFSKTDYRGIGQILTDHSDLRKALELTKMPHWRTRQKASKRLLRAMRTRRADQARPRAGGGGMASGGRPGPRSRWSSAVKRLPWPADPTRAATATCGRWP